MKKLQYVLYIFLFIACKPDKKTARKNILIKNNTSQIQSKELPIHGELTKKKLAKYYPKLTDTLRGASIFYAEKLKLNMNNRIIISLLHNTGTFDEIILITHNEKLELVDYLHIGKTTSFDNGKSQTINYQIQNNNKILFNKVDWGYIEEEIDTIKHLQLIVKINANGNLSSTTKNMK